MLQEEAQHTSYTEGISGALRLHGDRGGATGGWRASDHGPDGDGDGVRAGDHERVHVDPELFVKFATNFINLGGTGTTEL